MSSATRKSATIDDLYRVDGKAELIDGEILPLMATGRRPSVIASRISARLDTHAQSTGQGMAYNDNLGYTVPELSSGRESFSPDASYDARPISGDDRDFIEGPPTFAVEVRSKTDHGNAAERAMAAKRADYFEAGTLVVWDVDDEATCIRSYRADSPDRPVIFTSGQMADAEPAVPGWRVAVDDLFAIVGPGWSGH